MDIQMNEEVTYSLNAGPNKKRNFDEFMNPSSIMHKFKSKADFITYFGESCKV